jgi:hypothetical protein
LSKKELYLHPDKLVLYAKLIDSLPGIERKGATMPYTFFNGNTFSFLDKNGFLCLRLPEKERADFLKKYKANLCETHGSILKEYVLMPEKIFKQRGIMERYFIISIEYVKSLKPKPSKNSERNGERKSTKRKSMELKTLT